MTQHEINRMSEAGVHTFCRLLVATDCSERAQRAEVRAALLMQEHQCGAAELLTVRERSEPEILARITNSTVEAATALAAENAGRVLASRAALLKDNYGVQLACNVRFGQAAPEIVLRADELRAELTVIGAHGRN